MFSLHATDKKLKHLCLICLLTVILTTSQHNHMLPSPQEDYPPSGDVNYYPYLCELLQPSARAKDSRTIIPKFWTGKDAILYEDFQIDWSKLQVIYDEMVIDNNFHETWAMVVEMNFKFNRVGAVHLISTGLKDMAANGESLKVGNTNGMVCSRMELIWEVYWRKTYIGAPLSEDIHYYHEIELLWKSIYWTVQKPKQLLCRCRSCFFMFEPFKKDDFQKSLI